MRPLRPVLLLLPLLFIVECRDAKDEPTLQERAWGQGETPETATADRGTADAGDHGQGPAAESIGEHQAAPATREGLLALLRPDEATSELDQALLSAGLNALGGGAPSPQGEALTLRLVVAWAKRDLAGATSLALGLPEGPREDALIALLPSLARKLDAPRVPALIGRADLAEPATRRLLGRCARDLALVSPDAARTCHSALRDRGDRVALGVARDLASKDPVKALLWVAAIRDDDLRAEANAEVAAESGGSGLESLEDDDLRDWARTHSLTLLAEKSPKEALSRVSAIIDPFRRQEVLEAATWAAADKLPQGPATVAPGSPDCAGIPDPHRAGACLAAAVEAAVDRGDRDGARVLLQDIADDHWRAAALVPLFKGLPPGEFRALLLRTEALRSRLPEPERDAHLLQLLEASSLSRSHRIRDGLAMVKDPGARLRLIEEAGAHLDPAEILDLTETMADPHERALLSVLCLER